MSENNTLKTKDLSSSSSSSSSSSVEHITPLSSQETTLVEKSSLLPYVLAKSPNESPFHIHPRYNFPPFHSDAYPKLQQNKVGKFLNEDILLNDDDLRDVNDPEINMMSKLLPLDSYEIYENERDDYYLHQNIEKNFFKNIVDEDDSLQEGSQSPFPKTY
jgi:hypothetical protein